ncbi:MAG: ABC transporter ATP-binding protein [Kofleriaceae bacterium]|nr:ABC transporter ATP-binding protein [Kofleriaceae bacterium]
MIRVNNLSKYYGGKRALGPVAFEIADGETIGFLGLNGAGKTTALRILACDLRPSSGTVEVGGIDAVANPHEVRKHIGFLPENPPLYGDMVVSDYLKFAAELRGMNKHDIKRRMPEVLELTALSKVADEVINTLSHGYRQRVGVGQAIIHQPKFLILDEPTRGLDPVQIVEMRNLIHDLKRNHTVLISSHILTEISQTCDRLLVLGAGRLLGAGTEAELVGNKTDIRNITVTVKFPSAEANPHPRLQSVLATIDGVTEVGVPYQHADGHTFALSTSRDCRAEVSRAVVDAKLDLLKLDYTRSELENTFVRMVGTPTNGGDDARN